MLAGGAGGLARQAMLAFSPEVPKSTQSNVGKGTNFWDAEQVRSWCGGGREGVRFN